MFNKITIIVNIAEKQVLHKSLLWILFYIRKDFFIFQFEITSFARIMMSNKICVTVI